MQLVNEAVVEEAGKGLPQPNNFTLLLDQAEKIRELGYSPIFLSSDDFAYLLVLADVTRYRYQG